MRNVPPASFGSLRALPSSSSAGRASGRMSAESKAKKIWTSTLGDFDSSVGDAAALLDGDLPRLELAQFAVQFLWRRFSRWSLRIETPRLARRQPPNDGVGAFHVLRLCLRR